MFFDRKFGILTIRRCQGQNNSLVPRIEWCSDMKIHEIFGKYDVEFAVYWKISKFIVNKTTLWYPLDSYILSQSRDSKIRSRFFLIFESKLSIIWILSSKITISRFCNFRRKKTLNTNKNEYLCTFRLHFLKYEKSEFRVIFLWNYPSTFWILHFRAWVKTF